ncbi:MULTISPECIES: hypothetical protein [unclassified Helicobacter]|uniref:hypothetical protein n=1 Tax=unclassified Helicobacter TaxID=2593540 RepID=UPI000CF07DEC|nr:MULTISPECIES: hypothetical protein [unclassified Helicobacter]
MRFFGDFYLGLEEKGLNFFIKDLSLYDVVGFGYGCFLATEYAIDRIQNGYRIHKIVLISPIIDISDHKIIVRTYKNSILRDYQIPTKKIEKREWDLNVLEKITSNGGSFEVYIGSQAPNSQKIIELFKPIGLIYCFKEGGFDIFNQLSDLKQENILLQ